MDTTLCLCGHKVPKSKILSAIERGSTIVCAACSRLLIVKPTVLDAEEQLPLFDLIPTEDETIKAGKEFVLSSLKRGVSCPCCEQTCAIKVLMFTPAMAATLRRLYEASVEDGEWVNIKKWVGASKSLNRLKFWGAVVEKTDQDTGCGLNLWKITELGVDFIEHRASLSRLVSVYNNRLHSVGKETVSYDKFEAMRKVVRS